MNAVQRKGELSLQLIVVAAIVLIVLVVIVAIFTGKYSEFSKGTNACVNHGGECMTREDCKPVGSPQPGTSCSITDEVCCVKV